MECTVKCYYETGLTPDSCLDSRAKLDTLGFKMATFPSIWVLQDQGLGSIRIATNYNNIKNVDYCVINDICYHVTAVIMLNENTCELRLSTDYLTTVGVSNINIISGWCTRRCVIDDTPFSNHLPENFTPEEELTLDYGKVVKPSTSISVNLHIIISTVDLESTLQVAKEYTTPNAEDIIRCAVPQLPPSTGLTTFQIEGVPRSYTYPCAGCYDAQERTVLEGIVGVRSLGVESAIAESYTVPAEYVQSYHKTGGRFTDIEGISQDVESGLNPKYATVKNNKVFTGQFQKYMLMSIVSGDSQTFDVEQIVHDEKIVWRLLSNPLPNGQPYARPTYYFTNANTYWLATVKGAVWNKTPFAYAGRSGELIETTKFYSQQAFKNFNLANTVGTVLAGGAKGVVEGFGLTTAGAGTSIANEATKGLRNAVNDIGAGGVVGTLVDSTLGRWVSGRDFNTKRNIVAPEIQFAQVPALQAFIGNYFHDYRYRLSNADTLRFDDYLTMYGYAVFEPFTSDCFKGRQNFNYVMGENLEINAPFSAEMRNGCILQLQAGSRVWHVKPSHATLHDNPITR